MSKRIFSLILAAVMVFSLLPVFASAEGENPDPNQVAESKTYDAPGEIAKGGMVADKQIQLDPETGTYTITMSAYAAGQVVEQTMEYGMPLDIAIVIDQSGSMSYGTTFTQYGSTNASWTMKQADDNDGYVKITENGDDVYYPLEFSTGSLLESYTAYVSDFVTNQELSNYQISTDEVGYIHYFKPTDRYVKASDGTQRRVFASYFRYGNNNYVYLYYFKDSIYDANPPSEVDMVFNDPNWNYSSYENWDSNKVTYIQDSINNNNYWTSTNSRIRSATIYKETDDDNYYTGMFYHDKSGTKHDLITRRFSDVTNPTWQGTLYQLDNTVDATRRNEILKGAVRDFIRVVADKSKENNVEHKVALIGFAGNRVPSGSAASKDVYHWTNEAQDTQKKTGNRNWDYVNTGIYVGSQFRNYRSLTGSDSYTAINQAGEYFTNQHYYLYSDNRGYYPIKLDESAGRWFDVETRDYVSYGYDPYHYNRYSTQTYYEPKYTSLTPEDYQEALVTAYSKDAQGQIETETATLGGVSGEHAKINKQLTDSITMLASCGGTYTSYGLAMAYQLFDAVKDQKRADTNGEQVTPMKVVIVFTDGEPGGSDFEQTIADEALADATAAKQDFNAQIYALGLFPAVPEPGSPVDTFMHSLSSEAYTEKTYVPWDQVQSDQIYLFTNETEHKTYAVKSEGEKIIRARYNDDGTVASLSRWSVDYTASHLAINSGDDPSEQEYYSYIYTDQNGRYYATNLVRGQEYYVRLNGDGVPHKNGTLTKVLFDYYWIDTENYPRNATATKGETGDGWHYDYFQISSTPYETSLNYYVTVQSAYDLTERFNNITEQIEVPSTPVKLNGENSVLRDIISEAFTSETPADASNVTVSLEKGTVSTDGGEPEFTKVTNPTEDEQRIISSVSKAWSGKTLDVSGFDYGANYVSYLHDGYKLVVSISGLKPTMADGQKHFSNDAASAVYKQEKNEQGQVTAENQVVALPQPGIALDDVTKIIDFNAKMILAENAKFADTIAREDGKHNGVFSLVNEKNAENEEQPGQNAVYQLDSSVFTPAENQTKLTLTLANYHGVDSAMVYGRHVGDQTPVWKQITAVPANNVYYDDDLLNAQINVGAGEGYNAGLNGTTAEDAEVQNAAINVAGGTTYEITFTGTRIDVYCTTGPNKGQIIAQLMDQQGNRISEQVVMMRNSSDDTRFNIPTITFSQPVSGTYVLKLSTLSASAYELDGVRVYNTMEASTATTGDVEKAYEDAGETNAKFVNLRSILVNGDAEYVHQKDQITDSSVLFMDQISQNAIFYENGVVQNATNFIKYKNVSPKNEIYLAQNESVAFTISDWESIKSTAKVQVGLSEIRSGSGSVEISANTTDYTEGKRTQQVNSVVDMYYTIEPVDSGADVGTIMIKNNSTDPNALISVTNVKITGLEDSQELVGESARFTVSAKTLRYAARFDELPDVNAAQEEPQPPETANPEPTHSPAIFDVLQRIISNFVSALFNSIARLFGN